MAFSGLVTVDMPPKRLSLIDRDVFSLLSMFQGFRHLDVHFWKVLYQTVTFGSRFEQA